MKDRPSSMIDHGWLLQVLVAKDPSLLGKMFDVVITETGKHYLKGDVISESLRVVPHRPTPLPYGAVSGIKRTESNKTSRSWITRGDLLLVFVALIFVCIFVFTRYSQLVSMFS